MGDDAAAAATGDAMGTVQDMSAKTLPTGTVLPVAGVSFRQDCVTLRQEGEQVRLRHDVSNPYDRWAVAVETQDGQALGFVPSKGGLAQRLSESVPGGVWSATIAEVLRGETVGLRIRLDGLDEQRDARAGSDRLGLRSREDGVSEDGQVLEASVEDEQPPAKKRSASENHSASEKQGTGPVTSQVALGPGGRLLGSVIDAGESVVRVAGPDGSVRAYPSSLVTLQTSE